MTGKEKLNLDLTKGILQVHVSRGGSVDEAISFLTDIQDAYENLYALNLKIDELFDFTIHSVIGGAIMVAVKVLGDWILHKIKNPKVKDSKDNKPNE